MRLRVMLAVGAVLATLCATPAIADPCEAKLPRKGAVFSGVVRYVGDGDSLCVGKTKDPSTWIEVRVENFYAPELHDEGGKEARDTLRRLVLGKKATCIANNRTYDRIVATCSVGGITIGDLMRRNGIKEGGRGYPAR